MTRQLPDPPERCVCGFELTRYILTRAVICTIESTRRPDGSVSIPDSEPKIIEPFGEPDVVCADCGKRYAVPEGWPK